MEKLTNEFKIEFTKGDTYALAIKFKNITEDLRLAYFSVKENPDDSPLIQKSLGAGISKIDDREYKSEKTYKVQLQSADTINLEAKVQYLYDIQVTIGNVVKTVLHGVFVLSNTITGVKSATTQELEVAIDDELETEVSTIPATNGIEYETDPIALAKIGDMATLETSNTETIVKAINEVNKTAKDIVNGNTVVPKTTNVLSQINGKNISDIFENDGITVKKATYCQYASEDTSKGTIEERLANLGFKQGTITATSDGSLPVNVVTCSLTKQGKYVIANFYIMNSNYGDTLTIEVPDEFKPKEWRTFIIEVSPYPFDTVQYEKVQFTEDYKIVIKNSKNASYSIYNVGWETE